MVILKGKFDQTHFLNVDLEICSPTDLQPLVDAFGKRVFVLHVGRYRRSYEAFLEVSRQTKDADGTIRAFCELIRALPRPAKKLWNEAKRRDFSIGIQACHQPSAADFALSADTLQQAAKLGARIVITVYAPQRSAAVRDASGAPVFRGTSVPVSTLFDYLEGGKSVGQFIEGFPTVTREQVLMLFQEARNAEHDPAVDDELFQRVRGYLRSIEP
jgi:uncharacterized protein (DUF433 family)